MTKCTLKLYGASGTLQNYDALCVMPVNMLNEKVNLNENLETLHLAPTLFYYLPGFYLKTGFLNPHPLSLNRLHIECYLKKNETLIVTL